MNSARKAALSGPGGLGLWFQKYASIKDPTGKPVTPSANVLQKRLIEVVTWCLMHDVPIRLIMLKPRQVGCSTITQALAYLFMRTLGVSGIICGGKKGQAKKLVEMLTNYAKTDGCDWDGMELDKLGQEVVSFSNGAKFEAVGAMDFDPGRAGTAQAVIATEAARWQDTDCRNPDGILAGLMNCMVYEPRTMGVLESTGKGPFGLFYDKWQNNSMSFEEFVAAKERGADVSDKYIRIFAGWHEFTERFKPVTPQAAQDLEEWLAGNGRSVAEKEIIEHIRRIRVMHGLDLSQIAWYRTTLFSKCNGHLDEMKQDNPTTPEEAFHASANLFFDGAGLSYLETECIKAQKTARPGNFEIISGERGSLDHAPPEDWTFVDHERSGATFMVYETPIDGRAYQVIIDPMGGEADEKTGKRDHHAITVIRDAFYAHGVWMPPAEACCAVHPCQWAPDVVAEYAWALSHFYGGTAPCQIVVEKNKDPGIQAFLRTWGANLYRTQTTLTAKGDARVPGATQKIGFDMNSSTRPTVISTLARAIRECDREGSGIQINDLRTMHELKTFVLGDGGRGEAATGEHDDRVMALGMGYLLRDRSSTYSRRINSVEMPPEVQRHFDRERRTIQRRGGY